MDAAALDRALQNELSWPASILCPNVDGSGDYNLLSQTPQPFRKSKCVGKGVDLSPHSRQHTNGIRIPTTFAAVVGEWGKNRFAVGHGKEVLFLLQNISKVPND